MASKSCNESIIVGERFVFEPDVAVGTVGIDKRVWIIGTLIDDSAVSFVSCLELREEDGEESSSILIGNPVFDASDNRRDVERLGDNGGDEYGDPV